MRPKTPKDVERYQALLMHWFREEPALDYEQLTGDEAEQALQALMTATVDIGLQHPPMGQEAMANLSRWMESYTTGAAGTPTIH